MKRLLAIALLLASSTAIADWKLISTGTAMVVNKDYALTAAHVLEDCDGVIIRHKHKDIDAKTAALDATNDLGLLLLAEPFEQTAKFRGGKPIRLGDTVVNYGYPLFGELSDHAKISRGVINSLAGWGNDSRHIQYDAPTQPGNSGGPVLDLSGNVVGIVSSGLSQRYAEQTGHIAQNVNFAVKSFVAEAFLSSNGVDYEKADSIEEMKTADIAEIAETFTVLVGCLEGFDEPAQESSQSEETEPDKETESDEAVTIEKSEDDTCPEGKIQTYKGCEDSAEVAADRATRAAEAKARALAIAEGAGATTSGTGTGTNTGSKLESAQCRAAAATVAAAFAAIAVERKNVKIKGTRRDLLFTIQIYNVAKGDCFRACGRGGGGYLGIEQERLCRLE